MSGRQQIDIEVLDGFLGPIARECGVELIDIEVRKYRGDIQILVLADRPTGGITVDECSAVNRRLASVLAQEYPDVNNYTLEVASPGLDRPLKTVKDFERIPGRPVRVFLVDGCEGKNELEGTVENVCEETIMLKTDEKVYKLNIENISKGVQII